MPYTTHNRREVPVSRRFPLGIDYFSEEYTTFALAAEKATERARAWQKDTAVFCDEITLGRTTIAKFSPGGATEFVNDYANPARAHLTT